MLVVTGAYIIRPGRRDEFLKAVYDAGIYDEFLKEKGNISYNYYYPYGSADEVFFVERWEDAGAWEAHKTAPHTARLQELKAEYVTGFVPGVAGELAQ